jgi:uncharacterized membrane protein YfcA
MLPALPIGEIVWLALWVLAAGVVTGILAGLFGIGGGAIIVPVLYEVFRLLGVSDEVRIQLAIGTSLAIIVPTTIRSYRAHKAKGNVIPGVMRVWALPAIGGVAVGSVAAAFAPTAVFKIAFAVFAGVISIKMLFGRDSWNIGTDLPGRGLLSVYGFVNGLWSALIGVSGGSISNLILTLYGKSIHQAVATSAGIGVPITIAGTIGYMLAGYPRQALLPPLSIGYVSLIGLVVLAPVSSLAAPTGARLAHWLPKRQLEIAFGLFLILVGLRFIVSLL